MLFKSYHCHFTNKERNIYIYEEVKIEAIKLYISCNVILLIPKVDNVQWNSCNPKCKGPTDPFDLNDFFNYRSSDYMGSTVYKQACLNSGGKKSIYEKIEITCVWTLLYIVQNTRFNYTPSGMLET